MKINEILKEEYAGKSFRIESGNIYKVLSQSMYTDGVYLVSEDGNNVQAGEWMFYTEFELINESEWYDECTLKENDKYYCVNSFGDLGKYMYIKEYVSGDIVNNLKFFKTKEKALELEAEQLLYRKMKKFQEENDKKVDWKEGKCKYKITYDFGTKEYYVIDNQTSKDIGVIYFTSEELAERCLNKIVIPHKE